MGRGYRHIADGRLMAKQRREYARGRPDARGRKRRGPDGPRAADRPRDERG